jgi:hypothetical protein
MSGLIPEIVYDYWIIRHQIEKNKSVQRIRNTMIKERSKHLNRLRRYQK